ncbi:MAG: hypothetical protein LBO66_01155 [Deltaproteobacteria bacterium]|nr:hypothetical protein [Deltaproteobacteria bacterium]
MPRPQIAPGGKKSFFPPLPNSLRARALPRAGRPAGRPARVPTALGPLLGALAALFFFSGSLAAQEKEVIVYSAQGATTAVLPLWGVLRAGWPEGRDVSVREWKNLDDLRALILAGKGDVWAGHVETLARAASRGAPVSLVMVTARKKFYFLSVKLPLGENSPPEWPKDLATLASYLEKKGLPLSGAPRNGPAAGILESWPSLGGPRFKFEGLPPTQALLGLARGQSVAALLPEPLATVALSQNPSLAVIANLEEETGRLTGAPPRLPQAGIAVNANFARESPEAVSSLAALLRQEAARLAALSPAEAIAFLPPETIRDLGRENIVASLSRDPIGALDPWEIREEIEFFICLSAPDICSQGALPPSFPPSFIWAPPR